MKYLLILFDSIAGHQRPVSRRWPIYGNFLVFMNIYHFHAPTRKQNLFSVKICVHKVRVKKVTYIGMRKHYRDWWDFYMEVWRSQSRIFMKKKWIVLHARQTLRFQRFNAYLTQVLSHSQFTGNSSNTTLKYYNWKDNRVFRK